MSSFQTPMSSTRGRRSGAVMRSAKQIQRDVRRGNRQGGGVFGGPGTYYSPIVEPNGTAYR